MYKIPSKYVINDNRKKKDFTSITFNNYKKTDVVIELKNAIINNKIEDAISWAVELNISGANNILLNIILEIYFKYINISNVYLYIYINKQIKQFHEIMKKYKFELDIRNNQSIRNIIAELISLCCISKKNNLFTEDKLPKINVSKIYDTSILKKHISNNDLSEISNYVDMNNSKEIILSLNEILFNINSGSYEECIYWYLWLEKIFYKSKRNHNKLFCKETTLNINIEKNLFVWKIWEMLLNVNTNKLTIKYINKLFNDYINDFKINDLQKKKYLLFISFYIIKSNNFIKNLYDDNEYIIIQSVGYINKMYQYDNDNSQIIPEEEYKDSVVIKLDYFKQFIPKKIDV